MYLNKYTAESNIIYNPPNQMSIFLPVLAHILTGLAMHFIFHFYFCILWPRQDGCLFTQVSILLLELSGPFFFHATFEFACWLWKPKDTKKSCKFKNHWTLPVIGLNTAHLGRWNIITRLIFCISVSTFNILFKKRSNYKKYYFGREDMWHSETNLSSIFWALC